MMIQIEPHQELQQLAASIAEVVQGKAHLCPAWIKQNEWAVTPVERWLAMGMNLPQVHLMEDQIEWLVEAARKLGCHTCHAIPVPPSPAQHPSFRFPMTWDALFEFSTQCANVNYLLIPNDSAFVLLCSPDGYLVLAGPAAFVHDAVRKDIYDARSYFMANAIDISESYFAPVGLADTLKAVATRYSRNDLIAFTTITDHSLCQHLKGLSREMLDGDEQLDLDWIRTNKWAAALVSKLTYDPGLLAEALRMAGHHEVFAVRTFNDECYRVPALHEGLTSFHNGYNFFDILLFPEDRSCAMLNVNEYHNIIAGPRDFVVTALGTSIPTARKLFANRYAVVESAEGMRYMLETAQRYASFNGD